MKTGAPPSGARLWWLGARPRTLGASVVPVLAGTAAAVSFSAIRAAAAMIVSVGLQVGVNYANDYADGVRSVDTERRAGPVRLTASGLAAPRSVRRAALLAFAAAAGAGAWLALVSEPALLALGAVALAGAWLYSGGPRPYAGLGLGEVSVFAFFGLAATCGTAYVQGGRVPAAAWWAAVAIGANAVAILVANNLRDIPTDAAAGKRTLAVRLGDTRTRTLYRALVVGAMLVVAAGMATGGLPAAAAATFLAAPLVVRALRRIRGATGRDLVPALLATAALHSGAGALLAAGIWIG